MNKRGNVLLFGLLGVLVAFMVGLTGDQIMQAVFDSVNSALRANIVVGSGNISSIVSGITAINGGTDKAVCFDDGTTINCNNSNFTFNKNTNVGQLAGSSICTVANGLCGAAGSIGGSGTLNNYAIFTPNGTTIGNGNLIDNASGVTVQTASYEQQYTNNTGTGTTLNKLVKNDGTGKVIVASSSTDAVKGICVANCGTSGSAQVSVSGANVSCVFDNATTAGDYVQPTAAGGCHDAGSSFPTNVSVVGTVNTTNGGAGTYGVDLNGQDVAGATVAGGGGGRIGGSGADTRVAVFSGTRTLTSTANNTYDYTNFRQSSINMTAAADNSSPMVTWTGATPTTPTAALTALNFSVTSSGNQSFSETTLGVTLAAGYTGSSPTNAFAANNLAKGTGNTLNLGQTGVGQGLAGNIGIEGFGSPSATGLNVGIFGEGDASTSAGNIGVYGRASTAVAGTNIGGLFNAGNSTQGTNPKNIALLATLNTALPTGQNGSFGLYVDGGTLPDSLSSGLFAKGTSPTVPTTTMLGNQIDFTGAGSASFQVMGLEVLLNAGYTGSSQTYALETANSSAGTGSALNVGSATFPGGNFGIATGASQTTTGTNYGATGYASGGATTNVGLYGRGTGAAAGTNIGILGTALSSTQGTNFKNIAGLFSLHTAIPTGSNVSVALVADGAGNDIFEGFSSGTLKAKIDTNGVFSSGGNAGTTHTYTMCASGACATTCTIITTGGVVTGGTC